MNIIMQIGIVFGLTILGEIITQQLVLPIPGNIVAMLLLLVFLGMKWIKVSHIEAISDFLLKNMAFLFIPAGVSLIENLEVLKGKIGIILFICILTTIITLVVTGLTAQGIFYWQTRKDRNR